MRLDSLEVTSQDSGDFSGTAPDAFSKRCTVSMERKFTVAINGLREEAVRTDANSASEAFGLAASTAEPGDAGLAGSRFSFLAPRASSGSARKGLECHAKTLRLSPNRRY